jgi:two-component system, cell cycle response regulator DivK
MRATHVEHSIDRRARHPMAPMKSARMKSATVKEPSILVVDDYVDNRQMYAELLGYAGYRVTEAGDGAEAIATAMRILPDLIIMDLSLPVIDGWEATRRLKGDERTRHIPVLALTGHAPEGLAGHSEGAQAAGCDAFLAKPCSPEALLEIVQEMLARHRRTVRKARVRPRGARRAG